LPSIIFTVPSGSFSSSAPPIGIPKEFKACCKYAAYGGAVLALWTITPRPIGLLEMEFKARIIDLWMVMDDYGFT